MVIMAMKNAQNMAFSLLDDLFVGLDDFSIANYDQTIILDGQRGYVTKIDRNGVYSSSTMEPTAYSELGLEDLYSVMQIVDDHFFIHQ